MRLPLSEHKQLAAALDDPVECLHHKVGTLVADKAAHDAHDRRVRAYLQPRVPLQRRLAGGLPREIVRAEVRGDSLRRARVDHLDVDAVEHAPELPLAQAHHALEPAGIRRVEQLPGICRAHSCDGVRRHHSGLHGVRAAAHLECLVPALPREPQQIRHRRERETPLILDVVDGEHTRRAAPQLAQVDRHERRLPVVAVDNVRLFREHVRQLRRRAAEKREPLAVVILAVEPPAAEIVLALHEVPRHAAPLELPQGAGLVTPREVGVPLPDARHLIAPALRDRIVERQQHRGALSACRQRDRQAPRDVGQAARLAEGLGLTRYKQDVHLLPPPCGARAANQAFYDGVFVLDVGLVCEFPCPASGGVLFPRGKVPKSAPETVGFWTSFPVGTWGFGRTHPKFCIVFPSATLPLAALRRFPKPWLWRRFLHTFCRCWQKVCRRRHNS